MSTEQIDAKAIFNTARKIADAGARASYVELACAQNPEVMQRVLDLLRVHSEQQSFLESPPPGLGATQGISPIREQPGDTIGPYKLLQQIGEGGMGVVYMAEQKEPVERRVALKIIKPGMDTRQVIARFEAERQALAMMDHPNIARVLDAGTTDSGRPYFVMELVKGVPLNQYCDEKHLTPRERLQLFIPVCQAVQHAHQKGIIHRDIKPSNVLVALYDDKPVPKVIDFGVAKATSQRLTEKTMFTHYGQIVGTIDYMSPEQAQLNQLDVDTRSDIYSLGVLLYELLTGETPFDRQRLRSAAFDELLRIIREEEPPRPSIRLSSSHTLASIASNRHTEPKKLSTLVRGELDWIVMKAMEKDRTRRYETASGFASDIHRYLEDEPVQACPPSAAYRLKKYAKRNKGPLAVSACLAVATIIAGSFALIAHRHSLRETEARLGLRQAELDKRDLEIKAEQAERERRQHEQARLESERRARELEVVEEETRFNALVEEAQRLNSGVYPNFLRAEDLLTKAIEQRPREARLYTYRGSARQELGKYEDAIADLERSLALQPEGNVAAHWLAARAARQLGQEDNARQHEDLAKQQDPASKESLVSQALALPYDERGIELMTQAIERDPFDPALYFYRGRIAYNVTVRKTAQRYYDLSVSDLEKALRGRPHDLRIIEPLCLCLVQFSPYFASSREEAMGRAEALLNEWLAINPDSVSALPILADLMRRTGREQEAIAICQKGQELDPTRPEFPFFLAWSSFQLRADDEALKFLDQTLELRPQPYGHTYPMGYVDVHSVRAMVLAELGHPDEARKALQVAAAWEPRESWTFYDWHQLVVSYETLQDFAEVVRWCDAWSRVAPECPVAWERRASAYVLLGEWEKAARELERVVQITPQDSVAWLQVIPLLALGGDKVAYRRFCEAMVQRFGNSEQPHEVEKVIKACLLLPGVFKTSELPLAKLEQSLEGGETPPWLIGWFWATRALAEYRRGNVENALKYANHIETTPDYSTAVDLQPLGLLLKALALCELKRDEEARSAYADAAKLLDARDAEIRDAGTWHLDILIAQVLRREARIRFEENK